MYIPDTEEIIAEVISVACITLISLLFGRKVASIERSIYFIRGILLVYYVVVWAYIIVACMTTSTNNGNIVSCTLSMFNNIIIYTISKLISFFYFIEKIYIASAPSKSRLSTPTYILHLALLTPYIGLLIIMSVFRISEVSDTYPFHCTVGLELPATIAVVSYDTFISLLYTGILIKYSYFPNTAQQTAQQSSSLRNIARRTLVATATSLLSSFASYTVLITGNNKVRGVMGSTVTGIGLTAMVSVIHWVSTHPSEIPIASKVKEKLEGGPPVKLEIKQHQEVVVLSEMAP